MALLGWVKAYQLVSMLTATQSTAPREETSAGLPPAFVKLPLESTYANRMNVMCKCV